MRHFSAIVVGLFVLAYSTLGQSNTKSTLSKDDIKQAIKLLKNYVDFDFNYTYVPIVVSQLEETSNLVAAGRFIIVRQSLLSELDRGELTAVLAHELAHTEHGHFFKRLARYVGIPIVHTAYSLWQKFKGAPEHNTVQEHQQFLETMMIELNTKQEMQADCFAYQWLEQLQKQGFDVSPLDLLRSMTKSLGVNFGKFTTSDYIEDLPPFQRYKVIESGFYEHLNCASDFHVPARLWQLN